MHIPEPLYRSLPAIYGASGALAAGLSRGNSFALISATALICAGSVTAYWRFRHRATYDARCTARLAFESRKRRPLQATVQIGGRADTGFNRSTRPQPFSDRLNQRVG